MFPFQEAVYVPIACVQEALYQHNMLNTYVSTISASSFTESLHDLLNKENHLLKFSNKLNT